MRDWRNFGGHESPWIETDAERLDVGPAFLKKGFQFRGVIGAIVLPIQFEPESTGRRQVGGDIAQKIIPFRGTPKSVALVIIEANQIGGDEIKFVIEFW